MSNQPNTVEIDQARTVFKLLGDKTRLSMVKLLQKNECCVCEFVEIFMISQSAISQHLRKLKDIGLVKETRKGQWVFYSLNKQSEMFTLLEKILEFIPNQDERILELEKSGLRIICE